jgi:flagellar basal-body rod modification protein FlgD
MISGTKPVSTNSATSSTTGSSITGASTTDASASQDRFLKLLVAQLNNQDPMNPLDNAQMTSQIAQINTVSGIQQVNETLKSMSDQFASLQVLQGSSMVGRNVLVEGAKLNIQDGKAAGAIDLTARAESVKIDIVSPGGTVLDTLNLGAKEGGRHAFTWDASKYSGTGSPSYRVTATTGGQNVASTSMVQDKVTSVGSENGAMLVQLANNAAVGYSKIKSLL